MSGLAAASPQLDLSFRWHRQRGTWIDRRRFRWPYTIGRGFAQDHDGLKVIVQTVSGAIQADDQLAQHFAIGPGATAVIVTQGATPVHRGFADHVAAEDVQLAVEDAGHAAYLPEPRILFPDCRLSQRVTVRLHGDASAFVADGFVLHDPAGGARPFRRYQSTLLLRRSDGALLAADRIDLAGPPQAGGPRARLAAHGSLVLATLRLGAGAEAVADEAARALAGMEGLYAAASPLPNDAGVAARIAATDGQCLRRGLHAARMVFARHLRLGATACAETAD